VNTFAATNAFECTDLISSMFDFDSVTVLKSLDTMWGCSGICEPLPFYAFSDVNTINNYTKI
jgi:hypothetical protein